jgi:hypothetical protein
LRAICSNHTSEHTCGALIEQIERAYLPVTERILPVVGMQLGNADSSQKRKRKGAITTKRYHRGVPGNGVSNIWSKSRIVSSPLVFGLFVCGVCEGLAIQGRQLGGAVPRSSRAACSSSLVCWRTCSDLRNRNEPLRPPCEVVSWSVLCSATALKLLMDQRSHDDLSSSQMPKTRRKAQTLKRAREATSYSFLNNFVLYHFQNLLARVMAYS